MGNDAKNRRKTMRKTPKSTAKVECRRGSLGLGANLALRLLDISEIGMGVVVKTSFLVADEVEVVITDHGLSKPFKQIAKVCWCQPLDDGTFALGLSFDKVVPYAEICHLAKP